MKKYIKYLNSIVHLVIVIEKVYNYILSIICSMCFGEVFSLLASGTIILNDYNNNNNNQLYL